MFKTEKPCSYSRHTNYYQLWLEKEREIKRLESNLMDSKKVIRTLHLKLTDILKSIKAFEANQDLVNSKQLVESGASIFSFDQNIAPVLFSNDAAYQSVISASGPITVLQDKVKDVPSDLPENRCELPRRNGDKRKQVENVSRSMGIQPLPILADALPSVLPFKLVETKGKEKQDLWGKPKDVLEESSLVSANLQGKDSNVTYSYGHLDNSITAPEGQMIYEPSVLQENRTELEERNHDKIKNVGTSPEILPFSAYFEAEHPNNLEIKKICIPKDGLLSSVDVQDSGSNAPAFRNTPEDVEIIVLDDEVKSETCISPENQPEICDVNCYQEAQAERISPSQEIQPFIALPDSFHSEFTYENEQLPDRMEQVGITKNANHTSSLQGETDFCSREQPAKCGDTAMNILECFKAEPMEKEHNNEKTGNNANVKPIAVLLALEDASEPVQVLEECSLCHEKFKDVKDLNKQPRSDTLVPTCRSCQLKQRKAPFYLTNENKHICKICGKNFNHSHFLASHSLTHKEVNCNVNDKQFAIEQFLSIHTSSDNRPKINGFEVDLNQHNKSQLPGHHVCAICGKAFTIAEDLKLHHISLHTGPHECEICHKMFPEHSLLVAHLPSHTGPKSYDCKVCGKIFSYNSCLKQHQLMHSGLKPHKCPICGKSFARSGHFKRHYMLHTGEKPYECEHCHKRFSQSCNLTAHLRTHTREKPYLCEGCGKAFSFPLSLHRCRILS